MELFYQLLALFKYLASMGKGDFSISDYPLRYQYQGLGTSKKLTPWIVRIVGWEVMSGLGDTKPQALQDLKIRLDEYKKSNVSLPRPGTKVPLRFASTELIGCFPLSFIDDFLKSIFGIETALVTDESSLFDFMGEETLEEIYQKINLVYRIDASDIKSGNLVEVLERLSQKPEGSK